MVAAAGLVLASVAIVWSGIFGPGPNSTTVPSTSQTLTARITAPANNALIPIPPGTVQVQGNCAITAAQSSCNTPTTINVIYVLDVSGSTDLNFLLQNNRPRIDANGNGILGDAGDDFNGDGELGDVLDGEIAGVLALHTSIGNPTQVNVGVVAFATNAAAADVSPTLPNSGGITQVYATPPQVDVNGINGADIVEVLRSIDSDFTNPAGGQIKKFTLVPQSTLQSGTRFPPALTAINNALASFPPGKNIVFFLSDGESNAGFRCVDNTHPCGGQLATAVASCTTINTIGVGASADPVDLSFIANQTGGTYTQVTNPSQLSTILPLLVPAGLDHAEINGQTVPLDPLGNVTVNLACNGLSPFDTTLKCVASDGAHTSVQADVTTTCFLLCGNGVVDPGAGEECDPPSTPTCDAACQRVPVCGDSHVDAPESCDPPNGTTCDVDCTPIACGNAQLEPGEECEPPATATCDPACQRIPLCGDGFVDGSESCDPPNGTTCTASCTTVVCGDGVIQGNEECDPPLALTCDPTCQRVPRCGDGFVDGQESCDPPAANTCTAACTAIVCGDGVVEGLEQCDPPNGVTCDATCQPLACPDVDHDGICDVDDDCPGDANPDQADHDGDGIGDACDPCTDTDGDGFGDPGYPNAGCMPDVCPEVADDQHDTDGDGFGDACDDLDDVLNVFRARARGTKNPGPIKPKGKVQLKGDFVIQLAPGETLLDAFNADYPILIRVRDALHLDETFTWQPSECQLRVKSGALRQIRCRTADRKGAVKFGTLGQNAAAIRYNMVVGKLNVSAPFVGPLTVTLSHGDGSIINRVGVMTDCEASLTGGLRCEE
jgi:hypothetical protein